MRLIECHGISKSYGNTKVLNNVSLGIDADEKLVIQGSSGSGKSTLMYLLGGLDRAESGKVIINGHDLQKFNDEELAQFRNKYIGFVFQFHFLLPSMSCLQNILLPAQIGGVLNKEVKSYVKDIAASIGVDHVLNKYPYQLSGGEQQRVNIIRALSLKPKLLLCDEPTGNLDSKNSENVISLINSLVDQTQSTLVLVTHDNNIASRFKSKITIEDGRIIS
jgi:lipoprotein-releasing system ATP-binding protein